MTSRERVQLALQHKEADRIAIQDSPWATTVARWRKEGLPEGQSITDFVTGESPDRDIGVTRFPLYIALNAGLCPCPMKISL